MGSLSIVSKITASEDKKTVQQQINILRSRINEQKKKISEINLQIDKSENYFQSKLQEDKEFIAKEEDEEKRLQQSDDSFTKACLYFSFGLIGIAGVLLALEHFLSAILFGALGGIVLFILSCTSKDEDVETSAYQGARRQRIKKIHELKKELPKRISDHSDWVENEIKQINKHQQNITQLKIQIDACNQYLALPQSSVESFWYAKLCNSVGINQEEDHNILECRELIFSDIE